MIVQLVNPNTSAAMTAAMERAAREAAADGTTVRAVHPADGPPALQTPVDDALAVPGLLALVRAGEEAGHPGGAADGHVVACFGDPGLDAAREVARGPVVGVAEAAMRTALLLGRSFSVVTTLASTVDRAWDLVERTVPLRACRSVRAAEVPVLALEDPRSGAADQVLEECRRAVREDGCDVLVLGCAGMAELRREVSARLGVPVVDGVAAATTLVEGLVRQGLRSARAGGGAPRDVALDV